jgi:DNA-binding MarR family transcriptional regulator
MKKQTTDHETLIVQMLKAGQALQISLDQLFKQHGLSRQQYNVLRILRGATDQRLTVIELRARLIETQPDITRLLERMLQKELLSKHQDQNDKRKWHVQLEKPGLEKCLSLDDLITRWNKETFKCFNITQIQTLIELTSQFNQNHSKKEQT